MPIERRIREGAERNAGVLDPDVDRYLEAVVRTSDRRHAVRLSLSVVGVVAVVALVVAVGPSVVEGFTNGDTTVPGGSHTISVTPGVPAPAITGTFTRSIPGGTAVVRENGIAGTWTIGADADGVLRLLAPDTFPGAHESAPFTVQPSTIRTDAFASDICEGQLDGTYDWSVQAGFLSLSVRSDPCDARVAVLAAGAWELRA